ncbi:MAG: hypothetical protein AAF936_00615 [Pseudomonadota bacterium]
MTTMITSTLAAFAAVAGLAMTSVEELKTASPYDDSTVSKLTRADVETHAALVFTRADRDGDLALNADEFTALTVVTAELAHLNGFIVIEAEDQIATTPAVGISGAALSSSEQTRIEAVARGRFYMFSGADGIMDAGEFANAQSTVFEAADFNNNGVLAKRELSAFAQHHAHVTTGV